MMRANAQAVIDAFAAAGLLAYVTTLVGRRGAGPLVPRLFFLFGLMALFYGLRSLKTWIGAPGLQAATFAVIALAPFAALLLAEGVLRRHAPRLLKIAVAVASGASLVAALFTHGHLAFGLKIGLAAPVVLSLLAILTLLGLRDRQSLSKAENGVVRALAIGLAVALPLIVTDFPQLVSAPIGLSPIAVLLIALLILSSDGGETRDLWIEIGVIAVSTTALALVLAQGLGVEPIADQVRLFAILGAGLVTTSVLVRIQGLAVAGRRSQLRLRLGTADTSTLSGFLDSLTAEPALKDLTVVGEADLADYRPRALVETLAKRPLWSLADLRAAESGLSDAEREPLIELLERLSATHVGLLSRSPVQVGLVNLPGLSRNLEAEADLGLAFRMACLTPGATR